MPSDELESAMTFEARKHIPMDGTDAVIDYQIIGSNKKEVDKIDVGLVACTKGVLNNHIDLLKDCGLKPGIVDVNPIAMSNAFSFIKDVPEDGLVVLEDTRVHVDQAALDEQARAHGHAVVRWPPSHSSR